MLNHITEDIANDIESRLRETHNVQQVERANRRITVHFQGPVDMKTTSRMMLDNEESLIREYCNAPHLLYSDTTRFRFSLVCN